MNQIPPTELLSAYLDGEVTAEQRASVEAMLAQSSASRKLLADLQALGGEVRALPRGQLPANFADRVLRAAERRMLDSQGVTPAAPGVGAPAVQWEGVAQSTPLPPARPAKLLSKAALTPSDNNVAGKSTEFSFPTSVERELPEIVVAPSALQTALHGGSSLTTGRWQLWHLAVGGTVAAALLIATFKLWTPAKTDGSLAGPIIPAASGQQPAVPAPENARDANVAHFDWSVDPNSDAARLGKTPGPKPKGSGEENAVVLQEPVKPEQIPGLGAPVEAPPANVPAPAAVASIDKPSAAPAGEQPRGGIALAYVAKAGDAASQQAAIDQFEKLLKAQRISLVPAAKRAVSGVAANRNNAVNPLDRSVGVAASLPAEKKLVERAYLIEGTLAELQAALEQLKALTGDADAKLALEPLGQGKISVKNEDLNFGASPTAAANAAKPTEGAPPGGAGTAGQPAMQRALFIFRVETP